ncbi:MAG: ABC transporter ATP-binding protein [Lachnospirales bacterium]
MENKNILEVKNLKKYFPIYDGIIRRHVGDVKAVDGVSLDIEKGTTFSLVGESGCGKSTTGRAIIRLLEATSGEVFYKGKDILLSSKSEMTELRKEMQIVFQDPYSSLNPRMTISDTVGEALVHHGLYNKGEELNEYIADTIEMCGLERYFCNRFPHEFSGGQRQRVGIARALALKPSFVVADEPVSALDVSIQAQIINLLMNLQEKFGLSYLFISHDLSVVKYISDAIGVMYLGNIVETGKKEDIYKSSLHPYTQSLFSAIPIADPRQKTKKILLQGDIPSPANPPSGCKFHTRCMYAKSQCKEVCPELKDMGNGHKVACHLV